MVEFLVANENVVGSNPIIRSNIASYTLRLIRGRKVNWSHVGSIPTDATRLKGEIVVKLIDRKNDVWVFEFNEKAQRYLHEGNVYWKVWVDLTVKPKDFKTYEQVPLPVFTDWWPHIWN